MSRLAIIALALTLLVVVAPLISWRLQCRGTDSSLTARLVVVAGSGGVVFALASAIGIPAADLGLRLSEPWRMVLVTTGATALIIGIDLLSSGLLISKPALMRRRLQALNRWEGERPAYPALLAVFIIACACYEEILFRGFGFLLADWFGVSPLAALPLLALIFGAQHLAGGPEGVVYACVFGLFFGGVYLAANSIYPAIVCHAAGNAFTLFFTRPRISRRLRLMSEPSFLF